MIYIKIVDKNAKNVEKSNLFGSINKLSTQSFIYILFLYPILLHRAAITNNNFSCDLLTTNILSNLVLWWKKVWLENIS